MNSYATTLSGLMLLAATASADAAGEVVIGPVDAQPAAKGPVENFTGSVLVTSRFRGTEPARVSGGVVSFEPGAHTAWHTHPLGQTLVVTEGEGRVQDWGGPAHKIKVGDTVWIPPGVKHWHGAAPDSSMSHVAIAEALDGKTVEWMEKLTPEQYRD